MDFGVILFGYLLPSHLKTVHPQINQECVTPANCADPFKCVGIDAVEIVTGLVIKDPYTMVIGIVLQDPVDQIFAVIPFLFAEITAKQLLPEFVLSFPFVVDEHIRRCTDLLRKVVNRPESHGAVFQVNLTGRISNGFTEVAGDRQDVAFLVEDIPDAVLDVTGLCPIERGDVTVVVINGYVLRESFLGMSQGLFLFHIYSPFL